MAWTKAGFLKQLERAKAHLQPGEDVLSWSNGVCESLMLGGATKRQAILVATQTRLVLFVPKAFGAYDLEEYPYSTMSSIELSKGMLGHAATFIASGNRTKVTLMNQGEPEALVALVRSHLGSKTAPSGGGTTKRCPYCAEEIQAAAVFCRFCHKDLQVPDAAPTPTSAPVAARQHEPTPGSPMLAPRNDPVGAPATPQIVLAPSGPRRAMMLKLGAGLLVAGLVITYPIGLIGWGFLSAWAGMILVLNRLSGVAAFGGGLILSLVVWLPFATAAANKEKENAQQEVQVAAAQAAEQRKKDEVARLAKLKVDLPTNYERGLQLAARGDHAGAMVALQDVLAADRGYKDAAVRLAAVREAAKREAAKRNAATAQSLLAEAARLVKSDKCGETLQAQAKAREALRLDPSREKAVRPILTKAVEGQLACYEGNGELQMALQVKKRQPVTLYVWIKNTSARPRHANPGYFTLVTRDNQSHSYSVDTHSYSRAFPAVELQPGTETGGMLVFDTYSEPARLMYKELLGDAVQREFPQLE